MASISANGSKGHHKFTLTVTETSTSVSNNTSTISFRFQIDPIKIPSSAENAWDWDKFTNPSNTISYKVVIDGTTYSGTIPSYNGMGTLTLKSGTQTVSHNTDGTKELSFSFVVTDATTVNFTSGNASKTGTLALTPLATEKPSTGAAPIINPYVKDINDKTIKLTGDSSTLIRYHSSADATMNVTLQGGATSIKKHTIKNGSRTESQSTYTFRNVESNTFTFSAEDNKGYVGTKTYTANMVDYIRPTCNVANGAPDANGDMYLSCGGDYFNDSFGAKNNSLTVQYSYSGVGVDTTKYNAYGSDTMTVSTSGNTYTAYANLSGLDYQATYTFTIEATDELETVTSTKAAVKTKPLFHWSNRDFVFEVPVEFKGGLNGSAISCGTWTPSLSVSASYHTYVDENNDTQYYRKGWYQRIGNVVTIGWQIKATIDTDRSTTTLSITGIPYELVPQVNAFGGGVAFGIHVNAGWNFECWCVERVNAFQSRITARVQPCNNTSAGNLSVAQSAYYPSGDSAEDRTVTLSGTVCYMVK